MAIEINREHDAVVVAGKSAIGHALTCGHLLAQAKEVVAYGEWGEWLRRNFAASARTAEGYMRIANRWPEIEANPQRVADLTLRGALLLLAEPKPEPASDAPGQWPAFLTGPDQVAIGKVIKDGITHYVFCHPHIKQAERADQTWVHLFFGRVVGDLDDYSLQPIKCSETPIRADLVIRTLQEWGVPTDEIVWYSLEGWIPPEYIDLWGGNRFARC
jgi:hypothetical protein